MKKVCPKCQTEKEVTQFRTWPFTPDGYYYYCKECERLYALIRKTNGPRKVYTNIKEGVSNTNVYIRNPVLCVSCGIHIPPEERDARVDVEGVHGIEHYHLICYDKLIFGGVRHSSVLKVTRLTITSSMQL